MTNFQQKINGMHLYHKISYGKCSLFVSVSVLSILTLNSSGVHLIYLNKHDSKSYFCFSVLFVQNRNVILKQVNHAPFMFQIASKMMALEESPRKHTQKLKPTLWGSNPYSSLYSDTYNIKCFGSHDSQSLTAE